MLSLNLTFLVSVSDLELELLPSWFVLPNSVTVLHKVYKAIILSETRVVEGQFINLFLSC